MYAVRDSTPVFPARNVPFSRYADPAGIVRAIHLLIGIPVSYRKHDPEIEKLLREYSWDCLFHVTKRLAGEVFLKEFHGEIEFMEALCTATILVDTDQSDLWFKMSESHGDWLRASAAVKYLYDAIIHILNSNQ